MNREALRRACLGLRPMLALIALVATAWLEAREVHRLDAGWRFMGGDVEGAQRPDFEDRSWTEVRLPHDWSIAGPKDPAAPAAGHGGYFPTGAGWYRTMLQAPATWQGKRIELEFEGAAMGAEVWLNGTPIGKWVNGYVPALLELTPHLRIGELNTLAVRVDNSSQPNSRWYSGSGLYRPAWLRVTEPVHLATGGVWVVTESLSQAAAALRVQAEVMNRSERTRTVVVEARVLDGRGRLLASAKTSAEAIAGEAAPVSLPIEISKPRAWSPENPVLHRLITRVLEGDTLLDETETEFGLRTVRVSAERGFELNGATLKLYGGNVHHDTGPLGAAAFARSEERKVELLKTAGFNAVRTAHNPPSTAFLEACDRLGMLVVNEIFDGWEKAKNKRDYSVHFREWWKRDLDAWVRRDRHHASVVMWSIGNEMFERGSQSGLRIAGELAARVRELDPTRPVTAGVNGLGAPEKWPQLDRLFATLDVAGYNYELQNHSADHERVPQRIVFASESYQTEAFANWETMTAHPHVIGDFVWSAIDYLGEAGIGRVFPPGETALKHWEGEMFPWHGAYCGDLDLIGRRKPISHYRQIVWDRGAKLYAAVRVPAPDGTEWNLTPWSVAPLIPAWTFPGQEGRSYTIEVYSRHEAVRLELNGQIVGEAPTTKAEAFKAVFSVPYAPGRLRAIGLRSGKAVETFELRTSGEPAKFRLSIDRSRLSADGHDLAYVTIEAQDRRGVWQPHAASRVRVDVEGAGTLAALGCGELTSMESYLANERSLHQGRALAVIRAGTEPGRIRVTVSAPGMKPVHVSLKTARP